MSTAARMRVLSAENEGPPQRSATLLWWTVGLVVAGAFLLNYCQEQEADRRQAQIYNQATVLPTGVRDSWLAALDKSIGARVEIIGGRVRLDDDFGGSRWTPLQQVSVECDSFGIRLTDGLPDGVSLSLIGDFGPYKGLEGPTLGVGSRSPAARELYNDVCRGLASWLARQH